MAIKKDGRKTNGGARKGAGRKKKSDELAMLEKLKPMDALAFAALKKGLTKGDYKFMEIFLGYRFGKPSATTNLDITSGGNAFNIPVIEYFKTDEDED
jgi:hypothetical protein